MASIRRRGKKWEVRWRAPVGADRSHVCTTAKAAKSVKREVEWELAHRRDWPPADTGGGSKSLEDLVADYLIDCKRRLKHGTVRNIRFTLGHFTGWASPDGPAPLAALNQANIARWHGLQIEVVDRRTAASKLSRVLAMWDWAWKSETWEGLISKFRPVDPGDVPAPKRIPAPSIQDVDAAIAAAADCATWVRRVMVIQRYTGLRPGQADRLEWFDMDLDASVITIRPELGKSAGERRGRRIPMHPALKAELAGWGVRDGLVCGGAAGPSARSTGPRRAWREAGIEVRQPLHGIRHALITYWRMRKVEKDVRQAIVGHSGDTEDEHYVDLQSAIWPEMVKAIHLLPVVGSDPTTPLKARRGRSVGGQVAP